MNKILIFSLTYVPFVSGAEIAVKEITARLPHRKFDLITLRIDSSLPKFESQGNINIYRVGFSKNKSNIIDLFSFPLKINKVLFPFLALFKAIQLHKKNNYAAVWSIMAAYAGFAALFFKLIYPKVPFLLTLQEGDPIDYIKKRVGLLYPLFRQIFKRADSVQAISNYLAMWARDMGFRGSLEVVPNGVDLNNFQFPISNFQLEELKNKLKLTEDNKVIITTSRLVKKNAIDNVIDALQYLPANVKFLVLGIGPEEENLKSKILNLKLADRVIFCGQINHADLPKYLSVSDIFIRPSLSEGLGNSFLEAMAAGVPIIATPVGGIPDFLINEETGVYCAVNNPKDIALKVKKYLDNDNMRKKIIKQGADIVQKNYNWQLIASKMENVFNKLCVS